MKLVLIGSRHFGAAVLARFLQSGHEIAQVIAPFENDRLSTAAASAQLPLLVTEGGRRITGADISPGADLIVTAHSHSFVDRGALAAARLGGIGYHPSLLPRHRGKAAVEWTIRCGDAIAGGTVYQLTDRLDAGPIVAQDWCFVRPGETARELWERALSPLGIELLVHAVDQIASRGAILTRPQDEVFATSAPA